MKTFDNKGEKREVSIRGKRERFPALSNYDEFLFVTFCHDILVKLGSKEIKTKMMWGLNNLAVKSMIKTKHNKTTFTHGM